MGGRERERERWVKRESFNSGDKRLEGRAEKGRENDQEKCVVHTVRLASV